MIIQDLEYSERYVRIYLDTGEYLRVDIASVPYGMLHKGTVLDIDAYGHLKEAAQLFECKEKALYYISIKNRTEQDVIRYLIKKGFDKDIINRVVLLYREKGLLNDYIFARDYINSVRSHKVVGNRIIEKKLFEKGVDKSIIKKAMRDMGCEEDITAIYHLAVKKYTQIKDKNKAKSKIASFLTQRGFSWQSIKQVLRRFDDSELDDYWDE